MAVVDPRLVSAVKFGGEMRAKTGEDFRVFDGIGEVVQLGGIGGMVKKLPPVAFGIINQLMVPVADHAGGEFPGSVFRVKICLLYTSDAAAE